MQVKTYLKDQNIFKCRVIKQSEEVEGQEAVADETADFAEEQLSESIDIVV